LSSTLTAAAQTRSAKPIPRTADGKTRSFRDLGKAACKSLRRADCPAATCSVDARPSPSPAPYQEWTLAKVKEYSDGLAKADPIARCFLPGVPRINHHAHAARIVSKPGRVVILYEAFHAFRIIPTDGRKHPGDLDPTFMGDSVSSGVRR